MAMARNPRNKRHAISVRLDVALLERLDGECEARMLGRNLIVSKAIEAYLDRLVPLDFAEGSATRKGAGPDASEGSTPPRTDGVETPLRVHDYVPDPRFGVPAERVVEVLDEARDR